MEYELGVVIMGHLTNIFAFLVLIGIAAASILAVGHFPDVLSRFVAFYGVAACLDPVVIFVLDAATGNYDCSSSAHPECQDDIANDACKCWEGDAFKLYVRFRTDEGSGVIGVFLTLFVYVVLFLLAAFLLYVYLLRLHLDGRMLDLYRRLHAPERAFLVPDDFEVSAEELVSIIEAARGWRGAHEEKQRVAVCEYVLTDPLDSSFREVTTDIVIYKAHLNGTRTLYRRFLRHADGTIVELFGNAEEFLGTGGSSGLAKILRSDGNGLDDLDNAPRYFGSGPDSAIISTKASSS